MLYIIADKITMLSVLSTSFLLVLGIVWGAIALSPLPSSAQTAAIPKPSEAPLELSLLRGATTDGRVITSNSVSQNEPTTPSLWWAKAQFGDDLLNNWLAYPAQGVDAGRIDLLVNRQNWSLLDYIGRYEFVNHFGTVARDYGYNVRVFNEQEELLATYTCNFSLNPTQCSIQLDSTGKSQIRGSSQ